MKGSILVSCLFDSRVHVALEARKNPAFSMCNFGALKGDFHSVAACSFGKKKTHSVIVSHVLHSHIAFA